MNDKVPEIITRPASDLGEGDLIAPVLFPYARRALPVKWTYTYTNSAGERRTCVVPLFEGEPVPQDWKANAPIPLELPEGAVGLDYQRDTEPEQVEVPADALVVAVGRAAVQRPPDPFRDVDEVFGLRDGA